ncbi:MAG TPA: hypothetical protein VEZ70_02350 [Allosphingosinicella sp.]|nr:hypothetical protein [Allosphingosinicella sp.]
MGLLTALKKAEADLRAAEGACAGLAFAEAEAMQPALDRRGAAFERALRRVMRAPAPDLAALGTKVVLAVDHDVASLAGGEACLGAMREDALRLCIKVVL